MGFESFWLQFNNGKKEQLGDTKSGVRKEQVDKKFHNLFDAYDTNRSGVLESGELEGIFKTLSDCAGSDKILDNIENKIITSIFETCTNVKDIDFQGFVKSISNASADIVESKETQLEDGGKEIFTTYKDGTKETVGYYPNGNFKYKKTEKTVSETSYYIGIEGQQQKISKEDFELLLNEMNKEQDKPTSLDNNIPDPSFLEISTKTEERPVVKYDFSTKAKLDIQARDFLLSHFIETHYGTKDALDTMGILDDIGAVINAGAGEVWNACVNVYNKHFGNGTEKDYKTFYDLVKNFEPQYDKSLALETKLEGMQAEPEFYFKGFETDFENKTGNKYNLQKTIQFQQLAEQYQTATVLTIRMGCLKRALSEVRAFQSTQNALTNDPVRNEGINPAEHLLKAHEYLLQYFDNDKDAADLVLNGTIGNADKTLDAINSLIKDTKEQLDNTLLKKEINISETNDESFEIEENTLTENFTYEELKEQYQSSYKDMYGTDFVPDELTDKVMNAKATGGIVKIGAITIVSILITKSPAMANIMKAAAGAAIDGASANFIRGLVSKYGQTVVQQGIKFAMSTGTLATDVGLTLLNQVTDNREGINGEEVLETTKGAAKYIYFGAFVGSPIAQAVTQKVGKLGITGKLFANGTKTTQGGVTKTSISGEKLVQNFKKASQSIVAKGAGFATDIAAFTLLDITTEDIAPDEALTSQAEMLTVIRIMHKAFEYMLGARTHTAMQKAKWDAAIEKSGVKNWNIDEIKTPTNDGKGFKVIYDVDFNGIPLGKMNDINAVITAMMGKVSETYQRMETESGNKPNTETPQSEEAVVQEICDKYKDLSDSELQAELIKAVAESKTEEVTELTIAYTERGHKVSFGDSESVAKIENFGKKVKVEYSYKDLKKQKQKLKSILEKDKNLNKIDINLILYSINETNIELAKLICEDKEFPRKKISSILDKTNEINFELAKQLCTDKEFPREKIANILQYTNKVNLQLAKKLCADKEFPKEKIYRILLNSNEVRLPLAEKLCADKDFPIEIISDVLLFTNEINLSLAEKLCADKEFPREEISDILRCTNEDNISLAEKFYADNEMPRERISVMLNSYVNKVNSSLAVKLHADKNFPRKHIPNILNSTNEANLSLAEKLYENKEFPREFISRILSSTKEINIELAEKLCADKEFPKKEIDSILSWTNEINIELAEMLCADKDFPREDVSHILQRTNKVNVELAKKLCTKNFINKTETFTKILTKTNKNNASFFEKLCEDKELNINYIELIVRYTSDINILLAEKLCADKDFPREEISNVLHYTNEINLSLAEKLCADKEIPKEKIANILRYTNEVNLSLAEKLYTDKNFPREKIFDVLVCTDKDNILLAEKLCMDKSLNLLPEQIINALNAVILINKNFESLNLSEKISAYEKITSLSNDVLNLCREYTAIDIDTKRSELASNIGKKKDIITIPKEQQKLFVKDILANNNSTAENVLKNFDFAQFGKEGLPLKYTRREFTNNIKNLIKDLTPEEQNIILEHFGLTEGSSGFDGLPTNKTFDKQNVSEQLKDIAQKVQNEIELFTSRNEICTGDATVDKVLNSLIQGLPEFTSIVGKEQHGTHAYSVDIHTLKVLQSAMNNPLYEKLTNKDKTILKIAVLCHDFGKRGGVIDTGHASISGEYCAAILEKFPFLQEMKDRIMDIVENHHWFEAYNTGKVTAEEVAIRCRRPEDFLIYEILAKADFENVNQNFHITKSEGVTNQAEFDRFMQKKMQAIDEALTTMYSRANLVFDTQFVRNGEMFPRQTIEINGIPTELKVLNLNDLENNASLQEYGFSTGVTKENARFTVHMGPNANSLKSVLVLTQNSLNQSTWSTSLIRTSNNRTYCNRNLGVVLDVDHINIADASPYNMSSGYAKDINTFKDIMYNSSPYNTRQLKENLIFELSKKGIKLNDNDYAQLSKYLMTKKYTTQITKDIKIGDRIIKAEDLRKALETSRDILFENENNSHNEIVSINPRVKALIAKVEKLEECPEEFLNIAETYNLPIIIMRPENKHSE